MLAALTPFRETAALPPTAVPGNLRRLKDAPVFRMQRMSGERVWLFTPFLVFKAARGHHVRLLRREVEGARQAAALPFWAPLAVRPRAVTGAMTVARRYAQVGLGDYRPIRAVTEDLLGRARDCATHPLRAALEREPGFGMLAAPERRLLLDRAGAGRLPSTGGHGDFHMFNFCKGSRGPYYLLDWEHFDADGSFVMDYIEFHVANRVFGRDTRWMEVLRSGKAPAPLLRRLGARIGADPGALWLLYLLGKLRAMADRRGGLATLGPARQAEMLAVIRRRLGEID